MRAIPTLAARVCRAALALVAALALLSCDRRGSAGGAKTLYWVQALKGHPVHQLTQLAFKEGCRKLGYECEILGTDQADAVANVAQAEQALARGEMAGVAVWAGTSAYDPFIEKAAKAGVPVIVPHFGTPDPTKFQGARRVISCDPEAYAREAADAIGERIHGQGTVAITQGGFNNVENMVSAAFTARMKEKYPQVKVLAPEEEKFDPAAGTAKAVAILQANPDVVAALSTTGGGPTNWAGAQHATHRQIVAVGMDYTRVNLDLVRDGKIYAVIGQPLWDESFGAAELLDKCIKGEKIPWWTRLPAPLITKDKVEPFYELLKKVDAAAAK